MNNPRFVIYLNLPALGVQVYHASPTEIAFYNHLTEHGFQPLTNSMSYKHNPTVCGLVYLLEENKLELISEYQPAPNRKVFCMQYYNYELSHEELKVIQEEFRPFYGLESTTERVSPLFLRIESMGCLSPAETRTEIKKVLSC